MAAGMLAAGTNGADRFIGVYTEWCVRLPYGAITAMGALLTFVMANRLLSRRAAILGTVAMLTSPLFVFLARQAVPDPVFVGLLEGAMACLMIVLFAEEGDPHEGWAAAFYCFVGFATLSKGLLGFALPGAVTLVYCIATGEWHRLRRLHLAAGADTQPAIDTSVEVDRYRRVRIVGLVAFGRRHARGGSCPAPWPR